MGKLRSLVLALLAFAFASPMLFASVVSEEMAVAAAVGFMARSSSAARILEGREVSEVEARGNLWVVNLSPSGYILLAGSTKCYPVLMFSRNNFTEPEEGSPFAAKLSSDSFVVAEREADESAEDNSDWEKFTAPVTAGRRLLGAAPSEEPIVGPLLGASWGQGAPMNSFTPRNSVCGCSATAGGQELRYWRWPYRFEKPHEVDHKLCYDGDGKNKTTYTIRVDGRVPFNYDKIVDKEGTAAPNAEDKEIPYNTAYLTLWIQSLVSMEFRPGLAGANAKICGSAEEYWFEAADSEKNYWRDGYTNLWKAIKADLDWGSPIQVNSSVHQMVVDGYAIDNEGAENEVDWININAGWGDPIGWMDLWSAVTNSAPGGKPLADFQVGYRPQKIVQFEPVPKVSTSDVTLTWHLPPCYTNRTTGFTVEVAKAGGDTTSDTVATHDETTTYTVTGLDDGGDYTFAVAPIMIEGEGVGRTNSVTTRIGTPQPAPTIDKVASIVCGIDIVQQGFYIECEREATNDIIVTCGESTTGLSAYPSHLSVLPDEKVEVIQEGSNFTVRVDATGMQYVWDGDMMLLTLVATNSDGTEAAKNLMLRFVSMRQIPSGTFDIVATNATNVGRFTGVTTLDAKGKSITFNPGVFQGTGTVTLTDTVGGGAFVFTSLDDFSGTLAFSGDVNVTLPGDISGFAGTISVTDGSYALSSSLPASVTLNLGGGESEAVVIFDSENSSIAGAVTGEGSVVVTNGTCSIASEVSIAADISLELRDDGELNVDYGVASLVSQSGGTLNIRLTEYQIAYGDSVEFPNYTSGEIQFVGPNGNDIATTTITGASTTASVAAAAKVWTGTSFSGENYTQKWANNELPDEGEYVIFNVADEDGGDSDAMILDLPDETSLGYVRVMGNNPLKIKTDSGTSTERLYVDVLENDVATEIDTDYFIPTTIIPNAKLLIADGVKLLCEVDQSLAKNVSVKTSTGEYYAVTNSQAWGGTVVFSNYIGTDWMNLNNYGNTGSVVRLNGVTGYLAKNGIFQCAVELVDNGNSPAFNWKNGASDAKSTLCKLTGDGTFETSMPDDGSGGGGGEKILVNDVSGFSGSFKLAAKNVAITDGEMPSDATGRNGRLYINKDVEISEGKVWEANGGLYLGAGGRLAIKGGFATGSGINAYGEGAVLTLEDGGTIKVDLAMGGDYAPTLNFKAGTYKITKDMTETNTVNFCAGEGERTTLDANGHTFTLGSNFFSGDGDVYLTSPVDSSGEFVIQGSLENYTGTIYLDGSVNVVFPEDLSEFRGAIGIINIPLPCRYPDIGNVKVCAGAQLVVTIPKQYVISGCEIDSVTLVDGGTLRIQDRDGNELPVETIETIDGIKYVLAPNPDPDSAACMLDYEFNGNLASVGTVKTGLTPDGAASYYANSAIYTKCRPYAPSSGIEKMPDDEWTTFIRCVTPASNSEKPTIVIMFGFNGGDHLLGLVAGTNANTVALVDDNGIIGEEVYVDEATTQYHVYAIVKSANKVQLYVDGELKAEGTATVSIGGKFQIGSVHGSNGSKYASCSDENSRVDFLKFYDYSADATMVKELMESSPVPVAVWIAGEFEDDKSLHGGYELALNGNTIDGIGNILIGDATKLGATVAIPSGSITGMTMLVKYSVPNGGAPVTNSVPASVFSVYDMGALAGVGSSALGGYYLDGSAVKIGYDFSNPAQTMPQKGYLMICNWATTANPYNHGTAVYSGETLATLVGGEKSDFRFTRYGGHITRVGVGGPTTAGAEPWRGMVVKGVAIFDEWVPMSVIANYKFPVEKHTETDYPIPHSWIDTQLSDTEEYDDEMYDIAVKLPASDGYEYWECYVLGLDPTDPTSVFSAAIRVVDNVPVITYSPTNETLVASGDIEYILQGKAGKSDEFVDCASFDEPGEGNRIFRVKVAWVKDDTPKAIYSNEVKVHDVTFLAGDHGSLSGETVQLVVDGETVASVPTVTANTGYEFTGWDGDTNDVITATTTFTAQYELKTFTVTVNGESQTVQYGTNMVFNLPDSEGYKEEGARTWLFPIGTTYNNIGVTNAFLVPVTSDMEITFDWDIMATNYLFAVDAPDYGSIDGVPEDEWLPDGANFTLTATAAANYHFVEWTGDITNGCEVVGDELQVVMNQPRTIGATFAIDTYTVTFDLGDYGRLVSGELEQTVAYGSSAAAPTFDVDDCYEFDGWDVAFDYVTSNIVVTAQYHHKPPVTLTVYGVPEGVDEFSHGNGQREIVYGDTVELSVQQAFETVGTSIQECTGWVGMGSVPESGMEPSVSVVVKSDSTIEWQWETTKWWLGTSADNGTVSVASDWQNAGDVVELTATPATGYHFTGWDVDDAEGVVADGASLSVTMDRPRTIGATFAIDTFSVTFLPGDHGSFSGETEQMVEYDQKVTIAPDVVEDVGYKFTGWDGNTNEVIRAETTFTARYSAIEYTITYEDTKDAENPNPATYTVESNTITFASLANVEGWNFVKWEPSSIEASACSNVTVTAQWVCSMYECSINGESKTYSYDEEVKFTAPATWDADGMQVVTLGTTFTDPVLTNEFTVTVTNSINFAWDITETNYWFEINETVNGSTSDAPAKGWMPYGTNFVLTAETTDENYHFARWTGDIEGCVTNGTQIQVVMDRPRRIGAKFVDGRIGEAVGASDLDWDNDTDDEPWYVDERYVDEISARSGALGAGQISSLAVNLDGPGTLTFQWRTSCRKRYDAVRLEIDGSYVGELSGTNGWTSVTNELGVGEHTVRWVFFRGRGGAVDADYAAWLDNVEWVPITDAPTLEEAIGDFEWGKSEGDAEWHAIRDRHSREGDSFAIVTNLGNNGVATIHTTVNGAGRLEFSWAVSCRKDLDWFDFWVDDELCRTISGETEYWQDVSIDLEDKGEPHVLEWVYYVDGTDQISDVANCAMLDYVRWTPSEAPVDSVLADFLEWLKEYEQVDESATIEDARRIRDNESCAEGKKVSLFDEYVAGTNPDDPNSVFTANIEIDDGEPKITFEPDNEGLRATRIYTLRGKSDLGDVEWEDLATGSADVGEWAFKEGLNKEIYHFFRVDVELKTP